MASESAATRALAGLCVVAVSGAVLWGVAAWALARWAYSDALDSGDAW